MVEMTDLPRYDRRQSYTWNYEHAPAPVVHDAPHVPGSWSFCGRPVASPLGVAAGPLLNGRWLLYYASLGFDVLTYKTVRRRARACYPLPNLQPVHCGQLYGGERDLPAAADMTGSWAVSFGMPSQEPDVWRADLAEVKRQLPPGKLLSVSVVGTVEEGWTIEQLADDYALCARWAVESGADAVETNFSCPNVSTCDGQLYQQPDSARTVARRVREAIGQVPYVIKIGHVNERDDAARLLDAIADVADGLAMTNSIATTVRDASGQPLFDGQPRGICGAATREASLRQTALFARLVSQRGADLRLIGVGGISTAAHVRAYLEAGAEAVHLASAVMVDPAVGLKIRRGLAVELAAPPSSQA